MGGGGGCNARKIFNLPESWSKVSHHAARELAAAFSVTSSFSF